MFPDQIRPLREKLKLTQDQLAEVLGCTRVSLSRWENGACISSTYEKKLNLLQQVGDIERFRGIQRTLEAAYSDLGTLKAIYNTAPYEDQA